MHKFTVVVNALLRYVDTQFENMYVPHPTWDYVENRVPECKVQV
ncbi:MAG: hypothetical protein ACXACB_15530 [Promethearchaeota archaeon]